MKDIHETQIKLNEAGEMNDSAITSALDKVRCVLKEAYEALKDAKRHNNTNAISPLEEFEGICRSYGTPIKR